MNLSSANSPTQQHWNIRVEITSDTSEKNQIRDINFDLFGGNNQILF